MQLSITRLSHIRTTYIAKYLHCKINLKNSPSRIETYLDIQVNSKQTQTSIHTKLVTYLTYRVLYAVRTILDLVYSFVLQLPLPLKGSWTKANLVSWTTKMLITTKKMCPCILNIHIHALCTHTFKHTHASAHTSPHQYSLYRSFHTLVRSVGYKF